MDHKASQTMTLEQLQNFARFVLDVDEVLQKTTHGRGTEDHSEELDRLIAAWFDMAQVINGGA